MAWGLAALTHKVDRLAAEVKTLSEQVATIQTLLSGLMTTTGRLEQAAERIEEKMAGTQADLDAALDHLDQTVTAGTQEILTAVRDIAGKVGPGVDLSAEVQRVENAVTNIQNTASTVTGMDTTPGPTPGPAPTP